MARGDCIIVNPEPNGVRREAILSGALKPGTLLTLMATAIDANGHYTVEAFNRDADGDRAELIVLLESLDGRAATTAYVTGELVPIYFPRPGDELNVLMADVAGTADDHTIGEYMIIDDGTGKVIATTGTPEREPFRLLETVTDPTADQLVHVLVTGS